MPFSEGTVLQLHGILYRYMTQPGGHWKATNNDIVECHPDGSSRICFRPVAAHLTPIAMADLIARYRSALDQHLADPLVRHPGNRSTGTWHDAQQPLWPEGVAKGFVVQAKRWVVERTHAWNERSRRLIAHHDRSDWAALAWVWPAEARTLAARLAV